MNYSRQREAILETLCGLHGKHPAADAIYAELKASYPQLSLGTVYRNLNQLAQNGKIARIAVPNGADRYDDKTDGHLHMVCLRCGAIADVPRAALGDLCARAGQQSGHAVQGADILFYGVCNACLQAQQ